MSVLTLFDFHDFLASSVFVIIKYLLNWGNETAPPRVILLKFETSHIAVVKYKVQLGKTQK